jgi:hypothetical protein
MVAIYKLLKDAHFCICVQHVTLYKVVLNETCQTFSKAVGIASTALKGLIYSKLRYPLKGLKLPENCSKFTVRTW